MEDWIFAPERFRRLSLIFLGTYYAAVVLSWIVYHYTQADPSGYPQLIDFSSIWAAGRAAVAGNGARVYDFDYFSTPQIEVFGHQGPFGGGIPYIYPPHLLLYLAPLGLLPLYPAMVLWLSTTFLAAWAALRRSAPAAMLTLLGTAPSAVAFTIGLGQTSFLVTAVIGFSLALTAESPLAGGFVLGLLSYKPQLGLIFPVVLLAAGQWRVMLGATASTATLTAVTTLFFGPGVWLDFYAFVTQHIATFRPVPLEVPISHTVYGFLCWIGCPIDTAKFIHLCVVIPVVIVTCAIWRRPVPYALKAASLALGALLATPYLRIYDLVALAVPVAFLLKEMRRTGFQAGERFALLAAWLILFASMRPVGCFAPAILFVVVIRRAFQATPETAPDCVRAIPAAV